MYETDYLFPTDDGVVTIKIHERQAKELHRDFMRMRRKAQRPALIGGFITGLALSAAATYLIWRRR